MQSTAKRFTYQGLANESVALLLILPIASAALGQSPSDLKEGERIVQTYRSLLKEPRKYPKMSKGLDFYFRAIHIEDQAEIDRVNFESIAAQYIALRAIIRETGGGGSTGKNAMMRAIRAHYTSDICLRWSPEAQKLWLEATYVSDKKSTLAARQKIAALKKQGVDMEAMEAATLGMDTVTARTMLPLAKRCLTFAEQHPDDICAAFQACYLLEAASYLTDVNTRPHKAEYLPLVQRTFALEARTLKNLNQLLNDRQDKISYYDKLRKRVTFVQ